MILRLRKLENKDLDKLSSIMQESFKNEPWKETWTKEECYNRINAIKTFPTSLGYVLINKNDEIFGLAIGYNIPFLSMNEFHLEEFFVDKKYKDLKLGSTMMNLFLEELKSNNIKRVMLYTSGSLDHFYRKFNFKKDKEYIMKLDL